jgi:hypothetical protein
MPFMFIMCHAQAWRQWARSHKSSAIVALSDVTVDTAGHIHRQKLSPSCMAMMAQLLVQCLSG